MAVQISPKNSYYAETHNRGDRGEQEELMHLCNWSNTKANFLNMIGRVKDPAGKEPSVVCTMGLREEDVKPLVSQEGISPPLVGKFPMHGAVSEDFKVAVELFLTTPRSLWEGNLECDLPYLAMIIRKTKEKEKRSCWEIIPKTDNNPDAAKKTRQIAEKYSALLQTFGISLKKEKDGLTLYYSAATKPKGRDL